jgi:ClpP class serine protease
MENFFNLIFIIFLISLLLPLWQRRVLTIRRLRLINELERNHQSRVITLIHRQEAISFLGFPLARYIDIEDSEQVLRAIRQTSADTPIEIILHTPGGLVLASEQIASALKRHKAKVTAYVPHYAMSGGTLIALAAEEIIMDPDAVLGPVDPLVGDAFRTYPAASILAALKEPNPNRDDQTLILADIARKAIQQAKKMVLRYLKDKMTPEQAENVANALTSGQWTHDYPITADLAKQLGLKVSTDLPKEVYLLMDLYPQAIQRRPSVEYLPVPHKREKRK